MLRKLLTIVAALGLILPGTSILAQTAHEQTEKREMLQKESPDAGEQVRQRTSTREETQIHDDNEQYQFQYRYQRRSGQDASEAAVSGDELQDRVRDRDRDRLHDGSGSQTRNRGR